jgi:hypothetical protein
LNRSTATAAEGLEFSRTAVVITIGAHPEAAVQAQRRRARWLRRRGRPHGGSDGQLRNGRDDEAIDREFSAVCQAIWGFTLDDFTDDDLPPQDHAWLDELTQERAFDFAAEHGYDLKDYIHGGSVADWWGFTWMILAEARGVLTAEKRAAAWCRHGQRSVVGGGRGGTYSR